MIPQEFPGMKPAMELKGEENEEACPDSWELADLEESMKRLVPPGSGGLGGGGEESGGDGGEDPSQIDEFLREALQNPHDRMTILRLEHDVERFVKNPKQHQLEFPPMASSYMRLAAHRVAQHYYLVTSVIDSTVEGCRIIVRKSGENPNRLPSVRLADVPVAGEGGSHANTKFVIKQRPQASSSSGGDIAAANGSGNNNSKSVEERNEEYNKARARIFRHEQEQRAYDELMEVENRKHTKAAAAAAEAISPEQGKQRIIINSSSSSSSCAVSSGGVGGSSGSSSSSSSNNSSKADKDLFNKSRQKVAIFRDREKDRKDPDYDRNYDRYSQRFDPGFGLNQPPPGFGMQARYTPVVNYNTEFPQLGVRQMPPPPQAAAQPGWRHAYQQHQDMMRAPAPPPFNPPPPRVTPHNTMATYMSQYPYPRPSMAYHYSSQVSQPEAGSTQARRH